MPERVIVQNLQVERGSKKFGHIVGAEMPSSTIWMPIMIVNGAGEGPRLSLTAGIHGTEYTGIVGLRRLFRSLNPKTLGGTVVAAPVVNVPAFESARAKTRTRDLDQQMIQRAQHAGLFFPRVKQGDIVSKGQLLGEVLSVGGDLLQTVISPTEGVVRQTFPTSAVYPGVSLVDVCSLRSASE